MFITGTGSKGSVLNSMAGLVSKLKRVIIQVAITGR